MWSGLVVGDEFQTRIPHSLISGADESHDSGQVEAEMFLQVFLAHKNVDYRSETTN